MCGLLWGGTACPPSGPSWKWSDTVGHGHVVRGPDDFVDLGILERVQVDLLGVWPFLWRL
ncbi:MAG: hypothetical protein ACJARS_004166 [bacterium]|jgi:hypothetical protein